MIGKRECGRRDDSEMDDEEEERRMRMRFIDKNVLLIKQSCDRIM